MNKYTILKGCHYNTNIIDRFTSYSKKEMTGYAMLTESCWYSRTIFGTHINKLIGFSSDFTNKNSNRLNANYFSVGQIIVGLLNVQFVKNIKAKRNLLIHI